MNKRVYILFFFLFLVSPGCIRDDNSDCYEGGYLWFESINPKYSYEAMAKQVNLYLYDDQRLFAEELVYTEDDLKSSAWRVYIPTGYKGDFTIVALVNLSDYYVVSDRERLVTWKAGLRSGDNDVSYKLPDIYMAMKKVSLDNLSGAEDENVLFLAKNTNHIYLLIESVGGRLQGDIEPYIRGSNSLFNYENRLFGDRMVVYYPHMTEKRGNGTLYFLSTMLLRVAGDVSLYLRETLSDGTASDRFLFNIPEKLAQVKDHNGVKLYDTDQKLALEDEFYFTLVLDEQLQVMTLKVNDWYVIRDYIQIK